MVTIDIKSVQQILHKKITFGNTKCLSKKKSKSFVNHMYPIKMCIFYIYILRKYYKHTFTIKYCFSVHAHRYHTNLGNTDVLWQIGRGKVNRSRPTHYDIGMSLHYA